MVWFNYRRVPAISLAKQVVDEGRIGRPFHYRATYLQDWTIATDVPQGGAALWRLDVDVAGSGVTGDLLGPLDRHGRMAQRPDQAASPPPPRRSSRSGCTPRRARCSRSAIDDACMFLAVFANGSMGTFESTRYARGRKNFNTFELNGEAGSVFFDLEDPQYSAVLQVRRSQDGPEDRKPSHRLAEDPRHELRASVHEASGGCPAARSATSTRSSTPWPIS